MSLNETQIAYAYFTLDEWKMINEALTYYKCSDISIQASKDHNQQIDTILTKLPSASFSS